MRYERTIGYVPCSIQFGLKHNPQFVKVNRARWEVTLKTLPKQTAPYLIESLYAAYEAVDDLL